LNEADGTLENDNLNGKLFKALTNGDFFSQFENARGKENYGYTFFENELTAHSVENAKKYDIVLAGSTWCRDRMLEKGIHNCGVLPITEEKAQHDFVIFSGGKFELRKGQDLVLCALKILQEKYADIILVNCWYNIWPESLKLMGYSRFIKFEYQEKSWRDLMNHTYVINGLDPDRIRTYDLVANEIQREIYRNTDIGIFPNRCEGGTNLVLMEYMACAKPVIASYTSGHKDIVRDDNALLLNELRDINIAGPDDKLIARWQEPSVDELVAQIEYAYHHRDKIKKLGLISGRDLQKFTWEKCAQNLLDQLNL
jgi:glycosyltransferase involved in cell wall biosynthesis